MPTYIYKCNNCDHVFEARQRMSDDPLTNCPECEMEDSVRRVINSVGVVFKGSGFYVTDNRNGKNGTVSTNGTGGGKETTETTDSTTSTKDEKKSEKDTKSSTEKVSDT